MNANKWSLREMKREVFDVPHSLDECEARLELLDDPSSRLQRMFGTTRLDARTKVIKLVKTNPSNTDDLYCIQRTHPYINGIMHVFAEMNVGLQPAGDSTHVILYIPPRLNKAYLWAMVINSALVLMFTLVAAAMIWSVNDFVPAVFLFVGVGSVIVFSSTVLHFSESRAVLHRHVMWALTVGPLSEGPTSVNANKWSLRDMERETYVIPYSLDECEARLEQLDEPEPRFAIFASNRYFQSRTHVIKLVKINAANQDVMYCVQQVRKIQRDVYHSQPSQNVYAEMNIALHPESAATKVILYSPSRMTKAQKRELILLIPMGLFGAFILGLIVREFGGTMATVLYINLALIAYSFLSILFHYARQKWMLRRKIMQALSLDANLKE